MQGFSCDTICSYVSMYIGMPLRPTVLVQPGQLINLMVNNFNLSMQCGNYSDYFNYQWDMKNGSFDSRAQGINSHQLTITNLKPDDAGEYRCVMSNSTGRLLSDYVSVTIKGVFIISIKYYNYSEKYTCMHSKHYNTHGHYYRVFTGQTSQYDVYFVSCFLVLLKNIRTPNE